jgi:hypothetical protein
VSSANGFHRLALGLATALLIPHAVAGDHLFHRRQVAVAAAQPAVVTLPAQVVSAPTVPVIQLLPSYVPVVQVPVASTTTLAQAPVLSIKLEGPTPQAGAVAAPQAPSTTTPVMVPMAAVPVPLYVVPKAHAGLFKHRRLRIGN